MSRITGTDAFNMMEAYNAVYAPQELTEEQVWEEVESWVNSLLEEGYDLSDYTWEEMYEEYLNEYAAGGVTGSGGATRMYSRPVANTGSSYQSRFARPMNAGTPQRTGRASAVSRPQIGGLPTNYRGQELQQTATARASQVGTTRQGTAGGPTTGGNTPIGPSPTRPAATPARPAAAAPARPAAAAPARPVAQAPARPAAAPTGGVAKPTTTAPTTAPATAPAAPARSFNPLMQRTFGYQTGYAPSQVKQDPKKMAQMGSLRSISSSFDPFDIVQGYLIDEGYAETEEAAAVIMANMSDEWREEILEGRVSSETMGSDERRRERNDRYREENPTLPSGNPTGSNAQLMRQMAHAKKRGMKKKKD